MAQLLSRFGRPNADVRITTSVDETPPAQSPGGVLVTATLLPGEPFLLGRGWLELILKTTRFSRTVLDGYREHSFEEVRRIFELCENVRVQPGVQLDYSVKLRPPEVPAVERGPARACWTVKARFRAKGFREFSASREIGDIRPTPGGGPPTVDGTGFLPLYEFRAGP